MRKKYFFILFFILLCSTNVQAGGGRFNLYTSDTSGGYYYVGREMFIIAQVHEFDISGAFSKGERIEFRIDNPRQGDSCITRSVATDDLGVISASCKVSQPGQIFVYAYSLDQNEESSRYVLNFYALPTPTPAPTLAPTKSLTAKPTTPPTLIPSKIPTLAPTDLPMEMAVSESYTDDNLQEVNSYLESTLSANADLDERKQVESDDVKTDWRWLVMTFAITLLSGGLMLWVSLRSEFLKRRNKLVEEKAVESQNVVDGEDHSQFI